MAVNAAVTLGPLLIKVNRVQAKHFWPKRLLKLWVSHCCHGTLNQHQSAAGLYEYDDRFATKDSQLGDEKVKDMPIILIKANSGRPLPPMSKWCF